MTRLDFIETIPIIRHYYMTYKKYGLSGLMTTFITSLLIMYILYSVGIGYIEKQNLILENQNRIINVYEENNLRLTDLLRRTLDQSEKCVGNLPTLIEGTNTIAKGTNIILNKCKKE